jgi:hypothetical protein
MLTWATFDAWLQQARLTVDAGFDAAWKAAVQPALEPVAAARDLAERRLRETYNTLWGQGGSYEQLAAFSGTYAALDEAAQVDWLARAGVALGRSEEELTPQAFQGRLDALSAGLLYDATRPDGSPVVGVAPLVIAGIAFGVGALAWAWVNKLHVDVEHAQISQMNMLGQSIISANEEGRPAPDLGQLIQLRQASPTQSQLAAAGGGSWSSMLVPLLVGGAALAGVAVIANNLTKSR